MDFGIDEVRPLLEMGMPVVICLFFIFKWWPEYQRAITEQTKISAMLTKSVEEALRILIAMREDLEEHAEDSNKNKSHAEESYRNIHSIAEQVRKLPHIDERVNAIDVRTEKMYRDILKKRACGHDDEG